MRALMPRASSRDLSRTVRLPRPRDYRSPEVLRLVDHLLELAAEGHRALVQQAYKLFASHHYNHYDFLFSLSDQLSGNGLALASGFAVASAIVEGAS